MIDYNQHKTYLPYDVNIDTWLQFADNPTM